MPNAVGHVKWFSEKGVSAPLPSLSTTEWLFIGLLIIAGVILLFLLNRLMKKPDETLDEKLKPLRPWIPTIIRWSTAILLIGNYWQRNLYAPNINYDFSGLSSLLIAGLIIVVVMLLLGVYTRTAGAILLTIYIMSVLIVQTPIELLDHLEYVAIGLFLLLSDTGKLSVANQLVDPLEKIVHKFDYLAQPSLKVFSGLTLIVLAFSEKLLNMTLANDFLTNHSSWNFLSSFGLNDRNFIILAAIVEILIGLSLVLNMATRLSVLLLLLVMVLTALLLGLDEIIGHLFAVGLAFAVWVGPNDNLHLKKLRSLLS